MNRIEEKLAQLKKNNEKAFITYITAGLPDLPRCGQLIHTLEDAGLDILELGVPFSDPIADGPVIQDASYRSIQKGTTLKKTFDLVAQVRSEGVTMPIVFMMYYNTITYYGAEAFIAKCAEIGVDGLIIPDLPMEEQDTVKDLLGDRDETILLQLVAPVSAKRIPQILDGARGFVYCVSAMGVTGQSGQYHREILSYLRDVKKQSPIPVMMGFGITSAEDVKPMRDIIDGAIVGSHFIKLMETSDYDLVVAREYVSTFKRDLMGSDPGNKLL
ncbi:MAG: tryptophan synthase subunit alpha [Lachnospiraceae bacterium]|nr:tryptophan synthase subunit alpha [Lachnospiraceae bacterium]